MSSPITNRMRKLLIRDSAGNEMRIETEDISTLEDLESMYRKNLGFDSETLLFADAGNRRILGDKKESIGELWPELGNIEIIVLPDTVNA